MVLLTVYDPEAMWGVVFSFFVIVMLGITFVSWGGRREDRKHKRETSALLRDPHPSNRGKR